jgi:hypothetical protein
MWTQPTIGVSGVRSSCESTARKLVLRRHLDVEARRRLLVLEREVFVLMGPAILAQDRVSEYLQQLAVQQQPPLRNRLLLPGQIPQSPEGNPGVPRERGDRRRLREVHERVSGNGRADDLSLQYQRRPDDGETVRRGDNDRGPASGLRETLPRAISQNAWCVTEFLEQGEERRWW